MRVLVTGAAGFVGSNFVLKAEAMGIDILGIDNFTDTLYSSAIKDFNLSRIQSKTHKFKFLQNDCSNIDARLVDEEGIDAVVHFAALPGQIKSWDRFSDYVNSNIISTERILQAITNSRRRPRLILISTSSVYGDLVTRESRASGLHKPFSPYGVTKLAAEHLVDCYSKNFGIHYITLRLFSVFGPGQRPDMAISQFLKNLHGNRAIRVTGDGSQIRDFTFVDDVAEVVIASLTSPQVGLAFDVAGGTSYSIKEVLAMCAKITGRVPIVGFSNKDIGDQTSTKGDIQDAKRYFGLKTTVNLERGIELQYEYFMERVKSIGE